jgi:DNA-binding transcriptional MocR family regulator
MQQTVPLDVAGRSAAEIADDLRARIERGTITPGATLPPIRALAAHLGVNRNTVVAAYRQLAQAGLIVTHGRGGTRVADRATLTQPVAQEGYAPDSVLRDVGTGNPDPRRIPDPTPALARSARPVLYGEPVLDAQLESWADGWMSDVAAPHGGMRLTVTSGATDAIERLLSQALTRDDAVALEDPCFLASIHTVRLGGYRPVPVPVDDEGMTVAGLRAALEAGVRAVVYTPRAQNPTGASLSEERARALRELLEDHPYVLVVEDDHFSMLSRVALHTIIGPRHQRWARVRSVSKFLGPDMCLAVAASDPETAERLALRLTPGTTWVSHILQRLAHALVTDDAVRAAIDAAGAHYAERNTAFARLLTERGIPTSPGDGLNLWVTLPEDTSIVRERLMRRGWLARGGDEFFLDGADGRGRLRLTVHELDDDAAIRLADDIRLAAGLDGVHAPSGDGRIEG